ncbi:DUF4173 domain-containing protein [Sphingomonas panacisoli]|uniref:DUF4173 domain-containing protein n=1 Tax=Sphingomonas panacisoli TaxID=1813879 RepID=A0A5B8LMH1_9SPHN|nr:DUF4173 domain-containing protein [Sphingomonas panacisoli]QDZ08250.1 DUF4173 domain-containing protein [Sphingomonas panacisoli]
MRWRVFSSFLVKVAAALALVVLGDLLFWLADGVGSTLGMFAFAWASVTLLLTPAAWRRGGALVAGAIALTLGLVMIDSPGLLALLMFGATLAVAVLLPRMVTFDHVGRWAVRLVLFAIVSLIGPWRDLFRLIRLGKRRGRGLKMRGWLPLLPLPLIGGMVFLGLFANANPLIGEALSSIGAPNIDAESVFRFLFWGLIFTFAWSTLRPRRLHLPFPDEARPELDVALPGVSTGSVTLALITFNALFAIENGLDIAFLWSGAPLPKGVTLASYAHQGAYPLIATALLAGLFVLVALRPGSETAKVPLIRRLVVAWVAQNVFLVASSILRTTDYIAAYSLTVLRIAALLWMGLVAIGLVLIVWRMLRGKSSAWLINANAAAAGIVLFACTIVDLGSVAATWNVRHAKEAGGAGQALDLCYLNQLNASALTALVEMEQRPGLSPDFAQRLAWVRHGTLEATRNSLKGDSWTWRNQRRMAQIAAMLGGRPLPAPPTIGRNGRNCDGSLIPDPAPAPDADASEPQRDANASAPLTNEAVR